MYDRPMLGLKEAQEAIQVMIKEVESKPDYYWQHGVFAVVDFAGSLIALARMDGAHESGVFMAIRKAYSAATWAHSTAGLWNLMRGPMDILSFGTKMTLSKGGVPIIAPYGSRKPSHGEQKIFGELKETRYVEPYCVGAIGVGKLGPGEIDEEVAMIGVKYIESVLWPQK